VVAGFVACLTQAGEEFRAEMFGAVMTEDMLGARVDAARLHQRAELGDAQVDERRERRHVLAEGGDLGSSAVRRVTAVEPGGPGPRLAVLAQSGAHAHRVVVRVGDQVHPVHPQAQTARPGLGFHHNRSGAVGERPAQEAGVRHIASIAWSGERAADQLRAYGDRHQMLAETHRGHGRLERRHPRGAHPGGRQQLHRAAAQPSVHH
jgi:hypothetical protein